jgi:hypothetical protein
MLRQLFPNALDQRSRRLRFANRNTVQPNYRQPLIIESGQKTKTLSQPRNVFAVRERLKQKVR